MTIKEEIKTGNIEEFTEEVFLLPAGYVDADGVIHREFQIKEMTGVEEEAISKADIKVNGGKVMRTLIEKCCTRIGTYSKKSGGSEWRKLVQNLIVGDQDFIVLKIREQSIGEELEVQHKCQNSDCKANLVTTMRIDELDMIPFSGEFKIPFELPRGYRDSKNVIHRHGILRLPVGEDREILDPVLKKNIGEANSLMLTRCIVELGTAHVTNDLIRRLSIRDREYLLTTLKDNMFGVDLESEITCNYCSHEFKATLNMVNFL